MKLTPVEDRYTRRMRERDKTIARKNRRREKCAVREIETKCYEEVLTNEKVEYLEQKRI